MSECRNQSFVPLASLRNALPRLICGFWLILFVPFGLGVIFSIIDVNCLFLTDMFRFAGEHGVWS